MPFPLLEIVVEKKPGSAETRRLLVPTVADRVLQTAVARHSCRTRLKKSSWNAVLRTCRGGRWIGRLRASANATNWVSALWWTRTLRTISIQAPASSPPARSARRASFGRCDSRPAEDVGESAGLEWLEDFAAARRHPAGVADFALAGEFLSGRLRSGNSRKSGRKLIRYSDDFVILAKTAEEAQQSLLETETLLAQSHLELNDGKTRIADFAQASVSWARSFWARGFGFRGAGSGMLAALFSWRGPLPATLRARFETAPPKSAMELALARVEPFLRHHATQEGANPWPIST